MSEALEHEPGTLRRSPWTTAELRAALRIRYAAPAFALIEEVADSTGYAASRSCDALAVSCWKSAGNLDVHGFEIKASRADWLRELRDPRKAETFRVYCDRWWLVLGDRSFAKLEEVPETWGILAPTGDRLRAVREAVSTTPEPISRGFLAALARRMVEQSAEKAAIDRAFARGREEGYRQAMALDETIKASLRAVRRLRTSLSFEASHLSGILTGAPVADDEGEET